MTSSRSIQRWRATVGALAAAAVWLGVPGLSTPAAAAQQPEREPATYTVDQADAGLAALPAAVRVVPRRESRRRPVRAAAAGHRLPREVARALGRGALHGDRVDDAAGPPGVTGRRDLRRAHGVPAPGERRRARLGRAARGHRRAGRAGARLALAGRRPLGRRRPAARAGPQQSARRHPPGDRRHAAGPRSGRLAAVWRRTYDAAGYSPLDADRQDQRRRPAPGLVVGAAGRPERVDARRPRRGPVRARLRRQGARARRRQRRPAVGVRAAPAAGRGAEPQARHVHLRRPALRADVGPARRGPRRADRHSSSGRRRSASPAPGRA